MDNKHKALVVGAALALGGATLAASAVAADSTASNERSEDAAEGADVPISGPDLERASAVALSSTGEGRVTGTEIDDEESYYEVEVTLDDGTEVDVQLDESFNVVGGN